MSLVRDAAKGLRYQPAPGEKVIAAKKAAAHTVASTMLATIDRSVRRTGACQP